jgi:hypothetical protein
VSKHSSVSLLGRPFCWRCSRWSLAAADPGAAWPSAERLAYFQIEGGLPGAAQYPVAGVTFTNIVVTAAAPFSCATMANGQTPLEPAVISTPVSSDGGLQCSIASMTLYAPHAPLTSE